MKIYYKTFRKEGWHPVSVALKYIFGHPVHLTMEVESITNEFVTHFRFPWYLVIPRYLAFLPHQIHWLLTWGIPKGNIVFPFKHYVVENGLMKLRTTKLPIRILKKGRYHIYQQLHKYTGLTTHPFIHNKQPLLTKLILKIWN